MRPRPSSLQRLLLLRLLPALAILLLAGAGTAYWIAWRNATKAYDRALFDTALSIAEQLRLVDGKPALQLTPQARHILLIDKFDRIFFAVRDGEGRLLDGEAALPLPPRPGSHSGLPDARQYYDGRFGGEDIRLAAMQRDVGGHPFTIIAGETMIKRQILTREILLGMLLPEILLALASVVVVWFGIRAGLRPLDALRDELADRSPSDLRPIETAVPEELNAVIGEINALMARLAHSLDSQRHFVSDAAHQLRTPLAALLAQAEAALGEAPTANRPGLEGIVQAGRRLSRLVSQLLALARSEPMAARTGEVVVLDQLVTDTASAWLPRAIAASIDLGFELAPARVEGNALLLGELLGNLLDNALRHTPAGGTVTVACGEGADDGAWLTVDDSGPGIPAELHEQVFERFYRAPATPGEGCGLGLAIVREIARQHGATVRAEASALAGGARFRVDFPGPANLTVAGHQ